MTAGTPVCHVDLNIANFYNRGEAGGFFVKYNPPVWLGGPEKCSCTEAMSNTDNGVKLNYIIFLLPLQLYLVPIEMLFIVWQ